MAPVKEFKEPSSSLLARVYIFPKHRNETVLLMLPPLPSNFLRARIIFETKGDRLTMWSQ